VTWADQPDPEVVDATAAALFAPTPEAGDDAESDDAGVPDPLAGPLSVRGASRPPEGSGVEFAPGQAGARRRARVLRVLAVVLALMCVLPVGWAVAWFAGVTVEAGKGGGSPSAALLGFMFTFNSPADHPEVDRWIVPSRRPAIDRQRREYLDTMAADQQRTGFRLEFDVGTPPGGSFGPGDQDQIHGDTATAVGWYSAKWWLPPALLARLRSEDPGMVFPWVRGPALRWSAELRHDSGGWRLWTVRIPPLCDPGDGSGYARCDRPVFDPSAVPSPTSS
jgi:hypothetical protein